MSSKKIALFIDADNISAKFGKQILETLESRGEIFIRRIYGNWEKISLHGWNDCILNFSLRAIQQPDYVAGKNATDMSLTIDAMDVLYGGKAEIFVLVSNDSDFTPLAIRLREGGMKIIGMGTAQAANSFRMACSEFIDLDAPAEAEAPDESKKNFHTPEKKSSVQMSLFGEDKVTELKLPPVKPKVIGNAHEVAMSCGVKFVPEDAALPPDVSNPKVIPISDGNLQSDRDKKIQQIHEILRETSKAHENANGFCSINDARIELRNKNLGFTVRDFGYNQLKEFILAFPNLYETRQDDTGQNFFYRCPTSEAKIFSEDRIHEILREASALYAKNDGFVNLWWTCDFIISNKKIDRKIKSLSYEQLRKFIAKFPNLYEVTCRNNNEFLYRCLPAVSKVASDKLQKIHDVLCETAKLHGDEKGFVTLSWGGDAIGKKNLSIKGLGYSTLSKFIAAFPKLYEVQGMGTTICYRCLKRDKKISEEQRLKQIHAILQATAKSYKDLNDSGGFTDLTRAGQSIHNENLSAKDVGYSMLSELVRAFPNLYEVKRVGKNFYYRYKG